MKKLLILTALCTLITVAVSGQQAPGPDQGAPPTELGDRDGHQTANNAPIDPENFEVYEVQAGDTLWGIAGQFLSDSFLWPQLWESNAHIINPHWIYPEDKILIRPVRQITEAPTPEPTAEPVPEPEPEPVRQVRLPATPRLTSDALPGPEPIVFDLPEARRVSEIKTVDLYCSGFITTREISPDLNVMAKYPVTESVIATEADYIYLNQGSNAGIETGEVFTAVRATRDVSSPQVRRLGRYAPVGKLGKHYLEMGQLQTVMVQPGFSMARVVHSCGGIEVGDTIVGFQEIDFPELPSGRPFSSTMPSTGKTTGTIAISRDTLSNSGSLIFGGTTVVPGVGSSRLGPLSGGVVADGQIVYIDLGSRDEVQTGDIFLIYRLLNTNSPVFRLSDEAKALLAGQREVIGELVVLKVEELSATALITYAARGVSVGDFVELR